MKVFARLILVLQLPSLLAILLYLWIRPYIPFQSPVVDLYYKRIDWSVFMGAVIAVLQVIGSLGVLFLKEWGRRIIIGISLVIAAYYVTSVTGTTHHVSIDMWTSLFVFMPIGSVVLLMLPSIHAAFQKPQSAVAEEGVGNMSQLLVRALAIVIVIDSISMMLFNHLLWSFQDQSRYVSDPHPLAWFLPIILMASAVARGVGAIGLLWKAAWAKYTVVAACLVMVGAVTFGKMLLHPHVVQVGGWWDWCVLPLVYAGVLVVVFRTGGK